MIGDLDANMYAEIPFVYVKPDGAWPFGGREVPSLNGIESFPRLNSVPFRIIEADVDLLFGLNMSRLVKPINIVHGAFNEP